MSQRQSKKPTRRKSPSSQMEGWYLLLGILVVAILAVVISQNSGGASFKPEVRGAPRLKASPEEIDLGDVPTGQWITVSILLTNVGDERLLFMEEPYVEVVTGCCEPAPTITELILDPGDSTRLNMQFTIPEDKAGPQDYRVHVITNDPKSPDLSLKVLSNWVP